MMKTKRNQILCGCCWRSLKTGQSRCGYCGFVHDLRKPPMETKRSEA